IIISSIWAANTDADGPKVHLLSNLNGIQVMIAIGIHYKAFHLLAGAHIDGAVEDGEVVVDLIQLDGQFLVGLRTDSVVAVGAGLFDQRIHLRISNEAAVTGSTLLGGVLKGVIGIV